PHFGSGPIVGCSVTGGSVYRGCEFNGFGGAFFFGDFCSNEVVALRPESDGSFTLIDLTAELGFYGGNPSSFGTDADGNLYVVSLNGLLSRIVADDPDPACNDCIVSCNVADLACPIGVVDLTDIDAFIAGFTVGDPISDIAVPFGVTDLADVDAFINGFLNGCP
ncbi:MAG: GC-type dockerin domain-anchored protein, partial [Planctomycetota bacterium]